MSSRLYILGWNVRAAASSAARAGYEPRCIDVEGRRDLIAVHAHRRCAADAYPMGLLGALADWQAEARGREAGVGGGDDGAVLLTGGLENAGRWLDAVSTAAKLWGCSAGAIASVRRPWSLAEAPALAGFAPLELRERATVMVRLRRFLLRRWFDKAYVRRPAASFGGRGVGMWESGDSLSRGEVLQAYAEGRSISAVFAADGWSCRLVGATAQVRHVDVAEAEGRGLRGGLPGWGYAGSIGPISLTEAQRGGLSHAMVVLTQRFDLRGVFGVDAVIDSRGDVRPTEINPRYVDSIELLERATGRALLASAPLKGVGAGDVVKGKAGDEAKVGAKIRGGDRGGSGATGGGLYGMLKVTAEGPVVWRMSGRPAHVDAVVDVPGEGDRIAAGGHVCTIHVRADDEGGCLLRLVEARRRLLEGLARG